MESSLVVACCSNADQPPNALRLQEPASPLAIHMIESGEAVNLIVEIRVTNSTQLLAQFRGLRPLKAFT